MYEPMLVYYQFILILVGINISSFEKLDISLLLVLAI